MKAALLRIPGAGESEKLWKRFVGLRKALSGRSLGSFAPKGVACFRAPGPMATALSLGDSTEANVRLCCVGLSVVFLVVAL